ncbi:MAG: class F sortase, partial [Mycobacterium sp.]|nr:class F sortase [Mycobacterium sp.]
ATAAATQPSPSSSRVPSSIPASHASAPVDQGTAISGPAGDTASGGLSGPFALTVSMTSGTISTDVAPISVRSHGVVDPPHNTAQQWNTAAWVEQSTYPATPAKGTTYVYGHACHYHVCPFTNLVDAKPGDQIRVKTRAGTRVYTIARTGLSPKSARSLPSWASDSTVPNRIVLVTCAYEQGDTSTNNIVVMALLTRE